jgi:hypothetical protein
MEWAMIEAGSLRPPILVAVRSMLGKHWDYVQLHAEGEAAKMAQALETVSRLRLGGMINDDQAIGFIDMQRHAMQSVLLAVEGIGLTAAQNAVNAALGAVKDVINKGLPFPLL